MKVIFPYYKYSKEELGRIKDSFMLEWTDETDYQYWSQNPDIVQDPNGKKWGLEICLAIVSEKLEVGNKDQITALKALDFFNYLYNLSK